MRHALTAAFAVTLLVASPALARVGPPQRAHTQAQSSKAQTSKAQSSTAQWSRGERVPSAYRGGDYVVSDWQARHLKKPGRGYHWVHVNNQYLLIAIATGLIGSLIADGH